MQLLVVAEQVGTGRAEREGQIKVQEVEIVRRGRELEAPVPRPMAPTTACTPIPTRPTDDTLASAPCQRR